LSASIDKTKVGLLFCWFTELFAYIFCNYSSVLWTNSRRNIKGLRGDTCSDSWAL